MNLRVKTLLASSVATVLLIAGLSVGLSYLILRQITDTEKNSLNHRMDEAFRSLLPDAHVVSGPGSGPSSAPEPAPGTAPGPAPGPAPPPDFGDGPPGPRPARAGIALLQDPSGRLLDVGPGAPEFGGSPAPSPA